ncbi:Uncharacterised protein [Vibrio furnissii]|nr:Uncharacterised protein [Vibrio furnissii]
MLLKSHDQNIVIKILPVTVTGNWLMTELFTQPLRQLFRVVGDYHTRASAFKANHGFQYRAFLI